MVNAVSVARLIIETMRYSDISNTRSHSHQRVHMSSCKYRALKNLELLHHRVMCYTELLVYGYFFLADD